MLKTDAHTELKVAVPRKGVSVFGPVEDPAVRLVCLPHAGGSATAYRQWYKLLPVDVEVCAIELPGRGSRFNEPALTTMEAVVQHAMALTEPLVGVPYLLCGHSMGAVVALEVARRWCDKGRPPRALVVSACRAPYLPTRHPRPLSGLEDEDLVRELSFLDRVPAPMLRTRGFIETFLPMIRADLRCRETWRDDMRQVNVPLHVLGGSDDRSVDRADLEAWDRYSDRPIEIRIFEGGHFFIHELQRQFIDYLKQVIRSQARNGTWPTAASCIQRDSHARNS
jgi:surfactin synthase thioesterase subunit